MFDTEARIYVTQAQETVDEQAGANQEHQRYRNFGHHQQTAQTLTTPAGSRITPAFFQGIDLIEADCLNCRRKAKDDTRQHGNDQRKTENLEVDRDLSCLRNIFRNKRLEENQSTVRDTKTDDAAQRRQQNTFSQKLPD
jgi:hypothetical protein